MTADYSVKFDAWLEETNFKLQNFSGHRLSGIYFRRHGGAWSDNALLDAWMRESIESLRWEFRGKKNATKCKINSIVTPDMNIMYVAFPDTASGHIATDIRVTWENGNSRVFTISDRNSATCDIYDDCLQINTGLDRQGLKTYQTIR